MFDINITTQNNFRVIEVSGDAIINYISEIKHKIPRPENDTIFKLEKVEQYDFSFFQFLYYYIKILQNHSFKYQIYASDKLKKDFKFIYSDINNFNEASNE